MSTRILEELRWRGLIADCTDAAELGARLGAGSVTLYCGFDPTADSLHVGHLVPLLALRRFQDDGHRPIAVAGGATGSIGDPSGKSAERQLLTKDQIAANVLSVRPQLARLLDFERAGNPAMLVDNADWTAPMSFLDFLRDIGKHFTVNQMVGKESVRARMEDRDVGISYTEFSYMLLQAFDFYHLCAAHDCTLQIGGSDQWGNITAGIELARRLRGRELHGITCPLLTKADGTKMGKTAAGAVWLDPRRTSPYRFYQYWINLDDDDAGRCLVRLTDVPLDEVRSLDEARAANPAARDTQRRLAEELTRLVHGASGLDAARQATAIFFGAEIASLDDESLGEIFADVPSRELPRASLDAGLPLVEAFEATGLAQSRGAARRTIEQGGAYVNNRRIADAAHRLTSADLVGQATLVLRSGKKAYALLRFN
jgi:tyrosyl-tRNA synthetase